MPPKIRRRNAPSAFRLGEYRLISPPFVVAHKVDTHSCRPGSRLSHIVLFTGRSAQSVARWEDGPISHLCGPTAAVLVRESAFPFYAACSARVRCQCRKRFQQISANFLATATRAILALDRFRTRV